MTSISVLTCLLVLSSLHFTCAAPADVSHEDIRDAILSLVTIFRDNSDKLERHEYRERQLGEQLKKALAGLDKRYRTQDQAIVQMSERIKQLESSIGQKDAQERQKSEKILESVNKIQSTLDKVIGELDGSSKDGTATYTVQGNVGDPSITSRLDKILAALEDGQLKSTISEAEKLLRNLDRKVSDGRSGASNGDMREELEKNRAALHKILNIATQTAQDIGKLPNTRELQEIFNGTRDNLQEIREDLIANNDNGVHMILAKFDDKITGLSNNLDEIMKTTAEVQSMSESLNDGVSKSYDQLLSEVRGLSKVEQVMIQTADNVMDTKRRIEYGVHQILLEVGDLVKHQGKTLNGTVNQRFDDIESTILDNQTGALSNLTTKIEMEISQVWRQIGIMYQQLTASATALDRLQQQTDAYVNGSVKTMDSMEGKVGMITSRMTEVDENLNFLLGRLSLVTSEYNQIKSGLAGALDDIRNSFLEVQGKLKDLGPGPRVIPDDKVTGNDVPFE